MVRRPQIVFCFGPNHPHHSLVSMFKMRRHSFHDWMDTDVIPAGIFARLPPESIPPPA